MKNKQVKLGEMYACTNSAIFNKNEPILDPTLTIKIKNIYPGIDYFSSEIRQYIDSGQDYTNENLPKDGTKIIVTCAPTNDLPDVTLANICILDENNKEIEIERWELSYKFTSARFQTLPSYTFDIDDPNMFFDLRLKYIGYDKALEYFLAKLDEISNSYGYFDFVEAAEYDNSIIYGMNFSLLMAFILSMIVLEDYHTKDLASITDEKEYVQFYYNKFLKYITLVGEFIYLFNPRYIDRVKDILSEDLTDETRALIYGIADDDISGYMYMCNYIPVAVSKLDQYYIDTITPLLPHLGYDQKDHKGLYIDNETSAIKADIYLQGDDTRGTGFHVFNLKGFTKQGTYAESLLGCWYMVTCFVTGTLISTKNGPVKVEDVTYDTELLVWDFDEGHFTYATPLYIRKPLTEDYYHEVTFEDNKTLNVVCAHRGFCANTNRFEKMIDSLGMSFMFEDGISRKIISIVKHDTTVTHYHIITKFHMNLYAENVLTSIGLNNLYEIRNMKFMKDFTREFREYSYYDSSIVNYEVYEGLRLGIQYAPKSEIEKYVADKERTKK